MDVISCITMNQHSPSNWRACAGPEAGSVIKMAIMLKDCILPKSKILMCEFLCGQNALNAKDVHTEMFRVYVGKRLSCKAVHNCVTNVPPGTR